MPEPTLTELGDRYLELVLGASPFTATMLGVPGYDHRVPDVSDEAARDLVRDLQAVVDQARRLTGLDPAEEVTRSVLVEQAVNDIDRTGLREVQFQTAPFHASAHAQVLSFTPKVRLVDAESGQAYLDRLGGVAGFLDEAGRQLQHGTATGRTAAARSVTGSLAALDTVLSQPLVDDVLLSPAWADPVWAQERERLVRDQVRPALARLREVYRHDLLPQARPDDQVGLSWLPEGRAGYAVYARSHTTTLLTPEEVHALGWAELHRLEGEYAELGARLFGTDDPSAVLERMRTDPGLRLQSAEDLLSRSQAALDRAAAALPGWFGRQPPSACVLSLVPATEAVDAAPAFYSAPSAGSGRPGTYWVNAHEVTQRPIYDVEAIAFHEAVPGHHLQVSLAQQLHELPAFRRVNISGGYTEGWGLYSERLADEMGLYSTDLDRLGMLSCDSWRACRLVVDSGLHALGWSFEQAVELMAERTALPRSVIRPEVDRYVGLPGQALGYMVGRLEITRLRREAEQRLGDRFDLSGFHDLVLGTGAVPLTVLAQVVEQWTEAQVTCR